MQRKQTRDFLIRNLPIEIYDLLEKSAKEHHRSRTKEAIAVLTNGLSMRTPAIKKPKPFKWKNKISSKFIEDAIDEGRA